MYNKINRLRRYGGLNLLMATISVLAVIGGLFILVSTFFKSDESAEQLQSESPDQPEEKSVEEIIAPIRPIKPIVNQKKKVQIVAVDINDCLPNREPDIVSVRADITDYYKYVDGKWIWSE